LAKDFDFPLKELSRGMEYTNFFRESGRVNKILGPMVEGTLPGASVGGVCLIKQPDRRDLEAEIVGFKDGVALLMPMEPTTGIRMGARIELTKGVPSMDLSDRLLGKLLDAYGRPVDEPNFSGDEIRPIHCAALAPSKRRQITDRFVTGVRSIDLCTPMGRGQRLGVMAASGVGKSVLMGMIARHSEADVNVIALIGERGREVTEFIENDLGPEGMKRSIVVAVTSDQSPVLRVRGAYAATTIAEYFRDQGKNVLLMMDSVTRFGMALREIGLAAGEPPTTKGYTPSVFNQLPRLLERAGPKKGSGSITGLYTVLVEGNDFDDPLADAVRSILDGHIVLSRDLAARNHYPAIDVLQSVSRLTKVLLDSDNEKINTKIRETLDVYRTSEDLINIGGYRKGNNQQLDYAIQVHDSLNKLLRQEIGEHCDLESAVARAKEVLGYGDVQVPTGVS